MKANWGGKGRKTAGGRGEGGGGRGRWPLAIPDGEKHASLLLGMQCHHPSDFLLFCLLSFCVFFEGWDGQSTREEACKPSTGHATSSTGRSREENK